MNELESSRHQDVEDGSKIREYILDLRFSKANTRFAFFSRSCHRDASPLASLRADGGAKGLAKR